MTHRTQHSNVFRAKLNVNKKHIGFLIGPSGSVIRGLQVKYGIHSQILQEECVYNLSGPMEGVKSAIADIRRHIQWINNLQGRNRKPQKVTNTVDEYGWTTVKVHSNTKQPVKTSPHITVGAGRFEELDDSDEESTSAPTESKVAVPEHRQPPKLMGAWRSKLRVTFAHDATGQDEIREFDKNEPPICVSSGSEAELCDEDDAYMAQKTSTNAWRPACRKAEYKKKKNTIRQSWADVCDDMSSDSDDDEDIFLCSR